jgi:hypothetical protein
MTTTTDAPATSPAGAAPRKTRPAVRYPCGFCSTGHHVLCPATVKNGSAVTDKTWTCPCSEQGHTLGKQPPVRMEIVRMSPTTAACLAEIRSARSARTARASEPPAATKPAAAAPASETAGETTGETAGDGRLHTHCVKCGWDFGKPVPQARCGSQKMCDRRVELGDPAFGRRKSA